MTWRAVSVALPDCCSWQALLHAVAHDTVSPVSLPKQHLSSICTALTQGHHRSAEARCAELASELAQASADVAGRRTAEVAESAAEQLRQQLEDVRGQLDELVAQVGGLVIFNNEFEPSQHSREEMQFPRARASTDTDCSGLWGCC